MRDIDYEGCIEKILNCIALQKVQDEFQKEIEAIITVSSKICFLMDFGPGVYWLNNRYSYNTICIIEVEGFDSVGEYYLQKKNEVLRKGVNVFRVKDFGTAFELISKIENSLPLKGAEDIDEGEKT